VLGQQKEKTPKSPKPEQTNELPALKGSAKSTIEVPTSPVVFKLHMRTITNIDEKKVQPTSSHLELID